MGDGKGGGSKLVRRLFLLVLLGGGGGAGAYFKAWDRFAPPWLQSMVGRGALASPERLAGASGSAAPAVRDAAVGKTVRWKAKVVEVRRPIMGNPSLLVRSGDTTVQVVFPASADAELRALPQHAEVEFEGRLTRVPPEAMTVEDARLVK